MIKAWWVRCEVNMCAEKEIKMVVKATTQKKAQSLAINRLYNEGYFHVKLISCEEMQPKPVTDGHK